jgi:hypothetical protein
MDDMKSIPEVLSVFLVNGRYDVILHLTVRDVDHLRNLGLDRITSQPVVVNIETSIVYDSRSKYELPVLLEDAQAKDTPPRNAPPMPTEGSAAIDDWSQPFTILPPQTPEQ